MMIGAWQDGLLNLFSSANLQMLLLVGSGILAIALLSLALTRWGHSRPVRKCVILSFVAHILLMGFAFILTPLCIFMTPCAYFSAIGIGIGVI